MKAQVLQLLVCSECGTNLVQLFDANNKDYYLVCPESARDLEKKSHSQPKARYNVPKTYIDLEIYE